MFNKIKTKSFNFYKYKKKRFIYHLEEDLLKVVIMKLY